MTSGFLTSQLAEPHSATAPPLFSQDLLGNSRSASRTKLPRVYRSHPDRFALDKFSHFHNLCEVYEYIKEVGGQAAGIDGIRPEDVSTRERNSIIKQIGSELRAETYTLLPSRTHYLNKPAGGRRRLSIPIVFDRMVIKAVLLCLEQFWRARLPSFGRDVWITYAIMQQTIRRENKYFLAIDDIRNCYDSAIIDQILTYQRRYITKSELINLITRIIQGNKGPDHTTGLEQGSPYSPVAMEAFLHNRLDEVIRMTHPRITQLRYVDNLTYICNNAVEGQQVLQRAKQTLEESQMTLKGQDGQPLDIRDPQHNRSILGMIPTWQNGQLQLSIPDSAYQHLEEGITTTNGLCKTPEAIRRTMIGWLNATGPALTNTVAPEVVDRIVDIARRKGSREHNRNKLLTTAKEARKRWLALASSHQ